jgi:DNA-binding HxlR family transcriptional regulator
MLEIREQEEELLHFLSQYVDTHLKLDVLHFWGKYPNAKFSIGAITCALNKVRKIDLQQTVIALEREGLLQKHLHNGTVLYSLTPDPERRGAVVKLSACSWRELQRWHKLQELIGGQGRSKSMCRL